MAHAYTRYLGDLSGGQILGRIAQKSMGLKSNDGLLFFSFPGVSSPNLFKQLYRSRMNSIELTEEQRNGVLEEAVRSFELNIQVRRGGGEAEWGVTFSTALLSWWFLLPLSLRSLRTYRRCWVSPKTSCRTVQHTPNQKRFSSSLEASLALLHCAGWSWDSLSLWQPSVWESTLYRDHMQQAVCCFCTVASCVDNNY